MSDDDALLNTELHWTSTAGNRRRPAGSNAITAIHLVLTFLIWGITVFVLKGVNFFPRSSGVIDPMSLVMFFVLGAEVFVAGILAGRIWVAIGPGPRAVLRPLAVLGPWPMLIISFFIAVAFVAPFVAPFLPKESPAGSTTNSTAARESPAVTSGRNWEIVPTENGGATYAEALEGCSQAGGQVPSRVDLDRFDPPFPHNTLVWLAKPEDSDQLIAFSAGVGSVQMARHGRAGLVCFRP